MVASRPRGVLLVNLGTPDAPTTPAVRRYLRQFLMDRRVIDIPAVPRWLLVHGAILPTRPPRSAHAYQQIWTAEGSPLMVHGERLREAVAARLGPGHVVALGMRYGNPSLALALEKLFAANVREVAVLPLYPQYAASSTATAVDELCRVMGERWDTLPFRVLPEFYDSPGFIDAFAAVAQPVLAQARPDHVLLSFHGVPERQVKRSDPTGSHCLQSASCCEAMGPANARCYRAQCYATARALAAALQLGEGSWSVSFQSRLGRTPWIQPYTDAQLPKLAEAGVKRLAVLCPAFVADCLETLEEIGLRASEQFKSLGGEAFVLVPSLNAHPAWVDAVASMVRAT